MKSTLLIALLVFSQFSFSATSIVGRWMTIDDKTGQPRGEVELYLVGDELRGKIISVLDKTAKTHCDACPDQFKNQPVVGLEFMWGLKIQEGHWQEGSILDPHNGTVYSSRIIVSDDGKELDVRGYTGITLIGRSQKWVRE